MKNRFRLVVLAGVVALCALPAAAQADAPTLVTGPASIVNSGAVTVDATYPSAMSYTCALDGAAAAACTPPVSFTGLADGAHTLTVVASYMGTTQMCIPMPPGPDMCFPMPSVMQSDPLDVKFTVDTQAPVVTYTSGPNDRSASRSANATIVFSSDAGVKFSCTLDLAPISSCASPLVLNALKTGVHKLSITPTDAAGNVGAPLTRVFAVNSKKKTFKFVGDKVKRCLKRKHRKPLCKKLNF